MNLKIAYVPFDDDSVCMQLAETLIANHNANHRFDRFAATPIAAGNNSLGRVFFFQQTYIVGQINAIGGNRLYGTPDSSIGLVELASQLRDEGLTRRIRKIKLWVSNGGAGGLDSTASQFKAALQAAGFQRTAVYGYSKPLMDFVRDGHKMAADLGVDGVAKEFVPANSVRVRF